MSRITSERRLLPDTLTDSNSADHGADAAVRERATR